MANQLPTELDISRIRGDTFSFAVLIEDSDGDPINITGATFLLTVDPAADPADDTNNLFQLTGTIIDGPNGKVQFTLSSLEADQDPDTYYYDLQMTSGSAIRTIMKGQWIVIQDITKT